MYLKLMRRVAFTAVLLLGAHGAAAMPTQAQLDEVKPIVQELMAPLVRDYKAKKKLAAEVADGAMALVAEADTEAAKFALIKGAVFYYTRAKDYDKAADAIESLVRHIPDIPAPTLYEITSKAAANTTARTAPRLAALNAAAKKRAAVATRRASVAKELRKAPADLRLLRLDAELAAASGDWDTALAQFAKLGMAHERARGASPEGMRDTARIAAADADATGSDAEIADFWWSYTPAAPEAKDAIRAHAADLYRRAIDSGALDGLKRTLAEKRIAEIPTDEAPQLAATPAIAASASAQTKYKFVYRLDGKGNAILEGGNFGGKWIPCVSPKPIGPLVIPDSIDGHPVARMEIHALIDCDKITKLVLPKGLNWISPNAIKGCHALERIEIDASNNSYVSIDGALYTKNKRTLFCYPKARKDIKLVPGVKEIRDSAFCSCTFKTARLPEGVEVLRWHSFEFCLNLEEIWIPKSVNWIDPYQFKDCPNLKKVVFLGNAPGLHIQKKGFAIFAYANKDFVVEVTRGSKGWAGKDKTDLPNRWPQVGWEVDRHPIRYIK